MTNFKPISVRIKRVRAAQASLFLCYFIGGEIHGTRFSGSHWMMANLYGPFGVSSCLSFIIGYKFYQTINCLNETGCPFLVSLKDCLRVGLSAVAVRLIRACRQNKTIWSENFRCVFVRSFNAAYKVDDNQAGHHKK